MSRILRRLLSHSSTGTSTPRAIEQLTSRVTLIRALPSGPFSKEDSNTYLVGEGAQRILIDTGTGHPSYLPTLAGYLKEKDASLSHILLTHAHGNHTHGLVAIWRTFGTALPVYKLKSSQDDIKLSGNNKTKAEPKPSFLKDGQTIRSLDGSSSLKVLHTPGHSQDSVCFHLLEEDSMFTGDAVSSAPHGPTRPTHAVFEDLDAYRRSLQKITRQFPKILYPGHGALVANPTAYLESARECQNVLALAIHNILGQSGKPMSAEAIAVEIDQAQQLRLSDIELPVLIGTVKHHLLEMEAQTFIRRSHGLESESSRAGTTNGSGVDPSKLKGPGGLTLEQIYSKVTESNRRDWSDMNRQERSQVLDQTSWREQQHPLHVRIPLRKETTWVLA
ncbi:beta-lactamase-like protein [Polychytrium aggregatum]|uniref:beta-lactamase-like protein n=1 Tax=Polychytrium aggregatum TaxID=110093 RepID=UPI0022FE4D58|nr:beta-lactamase-like protein [Polychytrium aggregatum]KAI9205790.1 beta-lactamase-like protein [Polychytrium aggregatum]